MIKNYRINKIKEWWALVKQTAKTQQELSSLQFEYSNAAEVVFEDRLQDTKGFIFTKVLDFIVPTKWGTSDPCSVRIFRNGVPDWLDDSIINCGNDSDVKTFKCPYFQDNKPCNEDCRYRQYNNKIFELDEKLLNARNTHEALLEKRKAAFKQIFKKVK